MSEDGCAREGVIEVWRIELGRSIDAHTKKELGCHLVPAELERGERLVVEAKRRQFLLTRLALRRILSNSMGCSPSDVVIQLGENGKPFVEAGPVFSVSHSGRLAAVALARDRQQPDNRGLEGSVGQLAIGVDVEQLRAQRPLDRMAQRFFAAVESRAHLGLPEADRLEDFYRRWALKESYVKALGTGLTYSSRAFSLLDDEPSWSLRPLLESCERFDSQVRTWRFANGWAELESADLRSVGETEEKFALALCVNQERKLRFREYKDDC